MEAIERTGLSQIPYAEAVEANLLRTGDLVFIGGAKSLFGWLIGAVTRSVFSHVGIACWMYDGDGRTPILFIVEAHAYGRRLVSMAHYGKRRPLTVVRSPVEWNIYGASVLERTGAEPYGYMDLIGIGLKETLGLKVKDFDGEVCSEMVATVLNANGFEIDTTLSPGELFRTLLKRGCKIVALTTPQ